jgi:superfamily II DNA or RNA helicase
MVQLRDYQTRTIVGLRNGLLAGLKRQIAYLPTGGGKTRIAASLFSNVTKRGKRAAFICNRIELVQQASDALSAHGIHHGIIQGQNSHTTHANVLVCSIQTLARRGIPAIDFAIVDEAHTCAGSEAYRELFSRLNNIPIVGLSATPFSKGLGKEYKEMFGPMFEAIVVGATIPELILGGYLVDVDIYAPSEPDLTGVKMVAGDYEEKGLGEAVDKPKLIGDIVAHYIRLAMGKRSIVFATNVAHSQHIVSEFQRQGIDARHVDGYMEEEERRPLIDAFKRGEFPILSNCSLLAEGFDCPETEVIILARPTKSLIRYIQMAGRALRPHHSKDKALILDHSGTVRRLGFPTDELPLILDDGKPKEKKESENLPKVCKSCFAVYPRGVKSCPCCGFEPVMTPQEIEQEAGELQKLEKKRQKAISREDKQGIYSALYAVREKRTTRRVG